MGIPSRLELDLPRARQKPVEGLLQAVRSRGCGQLPSRVARANSKSITYESVFKDQVASPQASCGEPVGAVALELAERFVPPALPLPFGRRGANSSRNPQYLSTCFFSDRRVLFRTATDPSAPSFGRRSYPARLLRGPLPFGSGGEHLSRFAVLVKTLFQSREPSRRTSRGRSLPPEENGRGSDLSVARPLRRCHLSAAGGGTLVASAEPSRLSRLRRRRPADKRETTWTAARAAFLRKELRQGHGAARPTISGRARDRDSTSVPFSDASARARGSALRER
jgi:hypothetical protein